MSLKNTIYEHLKGREWVHKGELGRLAVNEWGYENENMGRRCREMENEGLVECKLVKNPKTGRNEAWYRIKPKFDIDKWNAQFYPKVTVETKIADNLQSLF